MRRESSRTPRPRAGRTLPLGLATLLLLALPSGSLLAQGSPADVTLPPEIRTDERETRYRVSGSTPAELRTSMLASGPEESGGRFYAYTSWHVRWRYDYAPAGGVCRMDQVDVRFRSRIQLPRWDPPGDADEELVATWRAFVAALREHEYGHRDIGARAARDILERLRSMTVRRCENMSERANAEAHGILDLYRLREDRYDRTTNHGETQGAVWPPRDG